MTLVNRSRREIDHIFSNQPIETLLNIPNPDCSDHIAVIGYWKLDYETNSSRKIRFPNKLAYTHIMKELMAEKANSVEQIN